MPTIFLEFSMLGIAIIKSMQNILKRNYFYTFARNKEEGFD